MSTIANGRVSPAPGDLAGLIRLLVCTDVLLQSCFDGPWDRRFSF